MNHGKRALLCLFHAQYPIEFRRMREDSIRGRAEDARIVATPGKSPGILRAGRSKGAVTLSGSLQGQCWQRRWSFAWSVCAHEDDKSCDQNRKRRLEFSLHCSSSRMFGMAVRLRMLRGWLFCSCSNARIKQGAESFAPCFSLRKFFSMNPIGAGRTSLPRAAQSLPGRP